MSSLGQSEFDSTETNQREVTNMDDGIQHSSSPPSSPPVVEATQAPDSSMLPPPLPLKPADEQTAAESKNNAQNSSTAVEEEVAADPLADPSDPIEDFDWHHLQERYHAKMEDVNRKEQAIMAEFDVLCNYFGAWAHAGTNQEVDRTFKRFKTQMTLVQHQEEELEQRRQHYIRVIDAFKNALRLLAT